MPTTDELITKALQDRADTVTAPSLRFPDFVAARIEQRRSSAHRRLSIRPTVLIAVAASVVAVLAIALGLYAFHPGDQRQSTTTGSDSTTLVNTRWQLTGVRSATQTYLVPANYRAEFSFATNGWVTGLGGINGLAGTYRTSGDRSLFASPRLAPAAAPAPSPRPRPCPAPTYRHL